MTKEKPTNIADSIRQKLLNFSKAQGSDFIFVLRRYAIERLLYRLSVSEFSNRFMLKGAMLFSVWSDQPYRTTLDVDFLASGDASLLNMETTFKAIVALACPEDGLKFFPDSVKAETIKEGQQYEGIRLTFTAKLGQAMIPIQVDLGFGDAVTPGAVQIEYPTLLQLTPPELPTYPKETVVSEKFQAMVALGLTNSRMKDFADLYFLANHFEFDGTVLSAAIFETFKRRQSQIPGKVPVALTKAFYADAQKQTQWTAFIKKLQLVDHTWDLERVCTRLAEFLLPPATAARTMQTYRDWWHPDKGWTPSHH